MNRIKLKIVVLLAVYLVGWCIWNSTRDHNRAWFEEQSGVNLPWGLSNVVHSTEFEFAITSHYTVPSNQIEKIVQRSELITQPPTQWRPIFRPEYLPNPWDQVPSTGDLLYATGANKVATWDLLLNRESGDLWTSIYYADAAGDLPRRVKP